VQNAPCAFLVEIDIAELDMDWIHPWSGLDWIGLDWVGLDWVQVLVKKFGLDWIGSEILSASLFFPKTERLHLVFSFAKIHFSSQL